MASGPERTALYRMFGAEDLLIYVGISKDFGRRWAQHAVVQPWYPEIQRQTVDWYPSRDEAEAAEIAAIKVEQPKYNKQHALKPPRSRRMRRTVPADSDGLDRDRIVYLSATAEANGGCEYVVAAPRIIAPGTYLITFDYDADGKPDWPVAVSQCVLVDAGDDAARKHGGTCREPEAQTPNALLAPACGCYQCRAKRSKARREPRCTCYESDTRDDSGAVPRLCSAHWPDGPGGVADPALPCTGTKTGSDPTRRLCGCAA